jgi:orotate phosphoribosyltransferase
MSDDLGSRMLAVSELHGDFVLSSGKRSKVYFDKFRFLSDPTLLAELADEVASRIPRDVTHLASPEGAAMLLLSAVATRAGLPMAVVRKQPKAYGTMSQVEGYAPSGSVVALIEDVSTTGGQTLKAAQALEAEGATIRLIILSIDRGGASVLRDKGYEVDAIVTIDAPVSD